MNPPLTVSMMDCASHRSLIFHASLLSKYGIFPHLPLLYPSLSTFLASFSAPSALLIPFQEMALLIYKPPLLLALKHVKLVGDFPPSPDFLLANSTFHLPMKQRNSLVFLSSIKSPPQASRRGGSQYHLYSETHIGRTKGCLSKRGRTALRFA